MEELRHRMNIMYKAKRGEGNHKLRMSHIVLNEFINDNRVLKEVDSLVTRFVGHKARVYALGSSRLPEYEVLENGVEVNRVRLRTRRLSQALFPQVLKYAEWSWRIILSNCRRPPAIVHCHDLNTLWIGIVISWLCRSRLIYDAHEFETEVEGLSGFRRTIAIFVETLLIRRPDLTVAVSRSIAKAYVERYRIDSPTVVRNIPYQYRQKPETKPSLRSRLGLANDQKLFLYQGRLTSGRGVESTIEAFREIEPKYHVLFLGSGPLERVVRETASKYVNIHYLPAVPMSQLLQLTSEADAGICMIEDTCLSNRFSLPNKLFEYLAAGIPILASNLPEIGSVIRHEDCGWLIEQQESPEGIRNLIRAIGDNGLVEKRQRASEASMRLSWDREFAPVLAFYAEAIG